MAIQNEYGIDIQGFGGWSIFRYVGVLLFEPAVLFIYDKRRINSIKVAPSLSDIALI
jgi:hypothetical protein